MGAAQGAGYRGKLGGIKQFLVKASEKKSGATSSVDGSAPKAKSKAKNKTKAVKSTIKKKAKGKKRTRITYNAEVTAAILKAVKDARATGKWSDAHAAATAVGYNGGLASLMQFVESKMDGSSKKKPVRKPKADFAAAHKSVAAEFGTYTMPEAVRSDFETLLHSKIHSEFRHSIKDKNVGKATAAYLEIIEARNFMESKIAALKKM